MPREKQQPRKPATKMPNLRKKMQEVKKAKARLKREEKSPDG